MNHWSDYRWAEGNILFDILITNNEQNDIDFLTYSIPIVSKRLAEFTLKSQNS